MAPPVVITGVVEARCPEDGEARSVAVFKQEPGKKARVATASGTKFAHGLALQDDLSFLSVRESSARGPRHSSGTRPMDNQQQMWFDSGRDEQTPQTYWSPGDQVCAQCVCCERCRDSKCHSDNEPEHLFKASQPFPTTETDAPVVPGHRKRCVCSPDVQPEPPSEQLFSDPSQSSPTVTVRAANDSLEPPEDNRCVAPCSSTEIASEKIIADESLSFANPISEEQLPALSSHTLVSPRPSLLQLPLPLPPPLPPPDQPLTILSAVPQTATECELAQIFASRSPDVSVMSEGEGHPSSSTASVEEEPRLPKVVETTFSEASTKVRLSHSDTDKLTVSSVSKVLPKRESSLRGSVGSATEPTALDIPSDKSIVPGSSGSLADKVKEAVSTDAKELMLRNQDISVIKSLLRMDAVDFIDVLLPVKFVSDPYERRKNILTNIETFFNRLHPITESEDVVQRRTTHFFEARKLAELIAPWNDIDDVERKMRASQFAKQVIETVVSMEEVGENKEIVQIRNFVETFLENIAMVSQCERNHERRRALRFEAFDKLERMFPIKRTLSLQKRSNIEGEIEVLLDKLVPHKQQRDGEEQLNSLQSGIEELLEIIILSADVKVDLETRSAIRMLVQGFLEDIHSADMTESECERACQLQETIERFVERILPHKPAEKSIRMCEVRRLAVGLFKDVVIRAQDEKCSLKRTKLRTTGRCHLGKIMYIAEEGRKRKSSVLLHRPQDMLYTIVPEERIKDKKERRTALQNWLENLLENIILSLRTVSFVYRKSTLRLLVSKFVKNLLDSEDVEDEFEKRNLVQCFERELLEKVIPQSAVEDNIIWSKMNVEVRMLLGNVVPLVHKENNPSKRSVLRTLAQEHLQFVFSVTEKVEKWKCCFQQNKFDERLDTLIPEELIRDKEERKSAFIQGVTELLESFVLYEDMGSTVQRRNILYHIVEKFVDDVEKAEGLVDKKDRVNELHRVVEKLVDIIIPTSVANDILRESQIRKEIVRLLKYSILPSFSEENQAKRRIFRSVALEYLLTIDPGEATKSDPSVRTEELAFLDLLFPSTFVEDTDKRKHYLIEGIRKLMEEIIVSCKPASALDKKTKLINVISAFVDNTQIVETCHDKHRRKSQIFHQVEDLIEQIIPVSDFENNMRLCQTRRELTYFLETIILASPNTDNVTRTVQRSTAKKHLHKIFLISSVPRNRTATLEKARGIVEYMIPEDHKESEEIVNLLEQSIREICEEIIVFVGDECDIRTNSELGAAVSNLVTIIRGSGSESHGDGRGHLEEVVGGFLERILPHRESEDNVVKSRVVEVVAQMIKNVVAPSFSERSYSRKSALRSLAMHHLQKLFPIVSRERKTVHKTKELLNELMPAELVKDKKKRKDDLVRIIQNLLESCVSSVGIESVVKKNIMNAAVQNFLDDLERIRQRIDQKDQGEVTDVVTKLLGTVLPESHCNDLFAGKLRKEIHRLLEDIVTPLQTGLRRSSTNILRSSASNILENIMAVSEVLKSRRHRVAKTESKESSKVTVILCKSTNSETEKTEFADHISWDETPFQQSDETHSAKKGSDPLRFLTAATGNIQTTGDLPTIFPKSNEIICEGCLIKNVVNDVVTKSMEKDALELASVCSEMSERRSQCSATSPDTRVVCYISEQLSGGPSVMTMAKDLDDVSEDVKSYSIPVEEEKHSKILDKIIPTEFEPDIEERKSNLKTGIKDFIESIILSGVYNQITMKSQLDGIVENFMDKMDSKARFDDRCQDSSEKQLFVTDLIAEVIPSSLSEDSRVSAVRKESAKLLNNIVIPSLSIRDVSRRSSMRFNAKELLESIIQEPDVPQVNYQGIMEKLFPKAEVEEKQEMNALKEMGIAELLETIILFVEVGSPILKRSMLRSSVREFQTNIEEAEEMKDEEEKQQEKTMIIAELVKKVIPDQSSEDVIMLRRLREDLLRFLEIVFNTNYGEDVTRAVDAQKAIESIFCIIGAFSRRDSSMRYQKYCEMLDSLIPERLEGTPQEIHGTVKKGIEELMESVVLSMDTLNSVERRSSLSMATEIFMQNLHDIKEMSVFVQDKAEKLVVADLIKKIFPNTSVNDSIHLLEVRRQTTSLLYKAIIPALDEKNLGRRHLLKTVARERLDNIVLLEELSERSCVSEEEILCLMNKLVPQEFIENREKRFCRVQRGIECLLEKIILSTEVGKDISMSSVHKFVQMMIDNISDLGEDISITEQNFHLEKYTTHLIDGIIPLEEADDNIRMEKLRNVLLEMLEDVLIIQIVCDGSKISLIRSLVHEKLLTILSIIKRFQNQIVSVQLKDQLGQMIDDMVPERYVDDEDIRMCILHNAMVDFLKEINVIRGLKQTANAEGVLKKEVDMLLSDISTIGDVKDRSARNIRAVHGVALFVRKLFHEEMMAKHTNMARIRNELQRLLIDVIIPAQSEQYPHERILLREKGVEHLEVIFINTHTTWKEMQLEDSRTLDIIDDLIPKHLDANFETRRSKLLSAVREFLQKLFPSGNVIMSHCRTIHNKLMDYATGVVSLKDTYDLENKRCSLRKVMHEVIRILNNVLEEHTDLRMVSACLEDLLLNIIPRGQMLRGIDARIMLRSEARHLMDMILTEEVPPQDSEQSEETEGSSLSVEDSSSPWDEDTSSRRSSKRFLNFIFPWTRKKKNSNNNAIEDAGSKAECSSREIRQKRSKKSLKRKRNI